MNVVLRVDGTLPRTYSAVGDEEAVPEVNSVSVSLARWERDLEALHGRTKELAIRIPNTLDVTHLNPATLEAALILIEFPSFGDGRGYSQATLLRNARGYRGELRATGAAVVRDQLLGMARCGIDSFELRSDQSAQSCMQALKDFSIAYQPALGTLPQIRSLRRRAGSS